MQSQRTGTNPAMLLAISKFLMNNKNDWVFYSVILYLLSPLISVVFATIMPLNSIRFYLGFLPVIPFFIAAIHILKRQKNRKIAYYWWILLPFIAIGLRILASALTSPAETSPEGAWLLENLPLWLVLTWMFIGSSLLAPIIEEAFFRGYLLPENPSWLAVIINALLFTIIHPWQNFTYSSLLDHVAIFCIGLILATLMKKMQNIYFVIILHALVNLTAFINISLN